MNRVKFKMGAPKIHGQTIVGTRLVKGVLRGVCVDGNPRHWAPANKAQQAAARRHARRGRERYDLGHGCGRVVSREIRCDGIVRCSKCWNKIVRA